MNLIAALIFLILPLQAVHAFPGVVGNAKQAIWNRQGVVIAAYTARQQTWVYEPTVIYEGSAQILSGNVFKVWYSGGYDNSDQYYAESLDGITWTQYGSNPVIADHARGFVFKDGATYYFYGPKYSDASYHVDLYTSSDGITWTLDTASALVVGGVGQWDHGYFGNVCVWKESANDWRMLYEAEASGAGPWKIGYATSADGRAWTKHASNPVISETGSPGGPWIWKRGTGDYWLWIHDSPSSFFPTTLARYHSTNLINWSRKPSADTLVRRTADEGTGLPFGQIADPALLEVNGKVYQFYTGVTDGTDPAGVSKIKLAIANMTLEQLIATIEGD